MDKSILHEVAALLHSLQFCIEQQGETNHANQYSGLFAIIVIDLVPAGDNAIVIALAARNLPKHLLRQAEGVRCRGAL